MRKALLALFLVSTTMVFSQDSLKGKTDSIISVSDSFSRAKEDEIFKETMKQNESNLNSFLQEQKEQEAKKKKKAILEIIFGVSMLVLLVFGLRRRIKK